METLTEPDGATVVTILPMPEHHNTEMIVDHSGSDLYRILEPILVQCESDPLGTCNIFLNAADSAAVSVYNTLCSRGFVFSGFKPLSHQSEYLVLHYAAHLPVALEDFILHPDFVEMKDSLSVFLRSSQ